MSRNHIRYFSLGLITASSILSLVYFIEPQTAETTQKAITEADVTAYLDEHDYVKVSEKEYYELVEAKEQADKTKQQAEAKQPNELATNNATEQKKPEAKPTQAQAEKAEQPKEKPKEEPKQAKTYTLSIQSGMSSDAVAAKLAANKMVKNADDYNNYLLKNNLQSSIRIGTYKITSDMTYQQISKIITKSTN
ncbi:endolytic transglycosylase MltG [Bacillus tianshenii]|nr:endolytic transglycosylase MltG [Bacillus tianshenii]